MTPLVSVIMPAYNCEHYIKQAIDSILNQTYLNIEILVADDASTDETRFIIDAYTDNRMRRFHNDKNLGYLKTCNNLFKQCRGEYITFQDADDWSDLNRIEYQLDFLKKNDIEICGTGIFFISNNNIITGKKIYPREYDDIKNNLFRGGESGCFASLVFSKNLILDIGGYREFFKYAAEDVDWFYRIIENYECQNIPKSLYYYRFSSSSITQSMSMLKQKASCQVAKDLAIERLLTGVDCLQNGDTHTANVLWEKHFNQLNYFPLAEELHKQNKLLRRHAYRECLKLWKIALLSRVSIRYKFLIITMGLLKMVIGIENYNIIKHKILWWINEGYTKKAAKLIIGHVKALLYIPIIYIFLLILKLFKKQEVCWLIGENYGVCLKDNGFRFYQYCRQVHPELNVYFVTKKISLEHYPDLLHDNNVVIYNSARHLYKLMLSNVIIFSHTKRDVIYKYIAPFIDKHKIKIFLQHGITAFKQFDSEYLAQRNYINIILATSKIEKEIHIKCVHFDEHKVKITGFPRYDYLLDSIKTKQQILFIPTWRNWGQQEFRLTEFFLKTQSFLNNKQLINHLEINGIMMKFYLHKNMANKLKHFSTINPNVIKIIALGEESVQQLIKESSLMITDYSSVAWDFLYLKKPVILYQHDIKAYLKYRGSYIDFKKFELSDIFFDETLLVNQVIKYINSNFTFPVERMGLHKKYFEYDDRENSQRVFNEIIKLTTR